MQSLAQFKFFSTGQCAWRGRRLRSAAMRVMWPMLAAVRLAVPSTRMCASENLASCTVVQLKEKLRSAGLPVSGRKADLIARLSLPDEAATALQPAPPVDAAVLAFPAVEIEACKQ